MIQYFFVIDFLENVIMQRPKANKPVFSPSLKLIKKKCLEHCKTYSYRYIDEISINSKNYNILASSTEDNIIVGVLIDATTTKRAKIWKMIEEVIKLVATVEDKEEGIKDVKKDIDKILEKVILPDTTDKINRSIEASTSKVQKLVNEQKIVIKDLEGIDFEVREIEQATEQQVQDSRALHWEAYWYNKKLQIFIVGSAILIFIGILGMFSRLIPRI